MEHSELSSPRRSSPCFGPLRLFVGFCQYRLHGLRGPRGPESESSQVLLCDEFFWLYDESPYFHFDGQELHQLQKPATEQLVARTKLNF